MSNRSGTFGSLPYFANSRPSDVYTAASTMVGLARKPDSVSAAAAGSLNTIAGVTLMAMMSASVDNCAAATLLNDTNPYPMNPAEAQTSTAELTVMLIRVS